MSAMESSRLFTNLYFCQLCLDSSPLKLWFLTFGLWSLPSHPLMGCRALEGRAGIVLCMSELVWFRLKRAEQLQANTRGVFGILLVCFFRQVKTKSAGSGFEQLKAGPKGAGHGRPA